MSTEPGAVQTTQYLYGGADTPLFETDSSGTITLSYIQGPGGDIAHYAGPPTTSSTVSYLYDSGHGDLAATANSSGTRTSNYTYDPFGAPNEGVPSNATTQRWTGAYDKQLDTTSNLIQMGARPYDPTLGRFLTVDPIDGGSLNNYDYAGQDPIDGYDLAGTRACSLKTCPGTLKHTQGKSVLAAAAGVLLRELINAYNLPEPGGTEPVDVDIQRNRKGIVIRESGTTGDPNTIRVSGITKDNPNGYVRYYNAKGDAIDPDTGEPGSPTATHIQPGYKGPWKNLPKWWTGK